MPTPATAAVSPAAAPSAPDKSLAGAKAWLLSRSKLFWVGTIVGVWFFGALFWIAAMPRVAPRPKDQNNNGSRTIRLPVTEGATAGAAAKTAPAKSKP